MLTVSGVSVLCMDAMGRIQMVLFFATVIPQVALAIGVLTASRKG